MLEMQAVGKISKIFTMQIIRRNIYGATYEIDFSPYFFLNFFSLENRKNRG